RAGRRRRRHEHEHRRDRRRHDPLERRHIDGHLAARVRGPELVQRRDFLARSLALASGGFLGGAGLAAATRNAMRADRQGLVAGHQLRKQGSVYRSWASSNPREAQRLDAYVAAIGAGQTPAPPAMSTLEGRGIVQILAAALVPDACPAPPPCPAPAPAPAPGPASVYQKGVGLWYATNRTVAEGQLGSAVEVGMWAADQTANYPAAALRALYKIGIEIKPDWPDHTNSASFVPYEEAKLIPGAIATKNGQQLMAYTVPSDPAYLADLGNETYQKRCAANAIADLNAHPSVNALYIDDMFGALSFNSQDAAGNGIIPDGYTSDADWRVRAAIPWLVNVCGQIKAARPDVYIFANVGDKPMPGEYYDGGDAVYRFMGDIVAAGAKLDGFFSEYWMQAPDVGQPGINLAPRPDQTGQWYWNAAGWQRLVARAQQLGKDFHGLVYANGGTAQRYARGCFLLDADL